MKRRFLLIVASFIAFIMAICIGPMDVFHHGNYCDAIELSNIDPEDFLGQIDLGEGAYEGWFVPAKKHFTGFKVHLVSVAEERAGDIVISVLDENGKILGMAETEWSKIPPQQWHMVYLDVHLAQGRKYHYRIEAKGCPVAPYLQVVDADYLGEENQEDGVLIGYMYAEPTFTFSEKVLFVLLIVTGWMLIASRFCLEKGRRKAMNLVAAALLMVFGLTWNYMFNSFGGQNTGFYNFQEDSETLVTGAIYAEEDGILHSAYGLGRYSDIDGAHLSHTMSLANDEEWTYGYSKTEPKIAVIYYAEVQNAATAGNYIRFANGDAIQILGSEAAQPYLHIYLDAGKPLNYYKYGTLLDAEFLDAGMQPIPVSCFGEYASQFGLQGKVFRHLARHIAPEDVLEYLNFLCSFALAAVFALMVLLIDAKYNSLLAACYFVVFLLSPWIVNFARNLYWVAFTWFLPVLAGLFCAVFIDKKWCRIFSYLAVFVAVMGKCLCGYEYITTVMISTVLFLLADLIKAALEKDKEKAFLLFRTAMLIGAAALLGFVAAICIHADLRGGGNIFEGIKRIIIEDVLRRTLGGDMNEFQPVYWDSFQSSVWEVLCRYFHFGTEVITGVAGNLFPLLCILSLAIFWYNYRKGMLDWNDVALYVLCFAASVSWYILGKQHSYIHVHMNYVLWYFGHVQMCFYVICKQVKNALGRGKALQYK